VCVLLAVCFAVGSMLSGLDKIGRSQPRSLRRRHHRRLQLDCGRAVRTALTECICHSHPALTDGARPLESSPLHRARSVGVLIFLCSASAVHDGSCHPDLPSSVGRPFSAAHILGTASGSLLRPAASRLLLSRFLPLTRWVPPIKQPLALEAEATRFWVPQENGARKRRKFSYVLPQLYNSRRVRWF
jgi:hypothetical protein